MKKLLVYAINCLIDGLTHELIKESQEIPRYQANIRSPGKFQALYEGFKVARVIGIIFLIDLTIKDHRFALQSRRGQKNMLVRT